MRLTGTHIHYYFVCKRKLWFFSHGITMENNSDLVQLGRHIHEESYKKSKKEILIDSIKIDFIKNKNEIHEVKKSMKMQKAHRYQLLYYLYELKKRGVIMEGILDYPNERKIERVILNDENERELEGILGDIKKIISLDKPPERCTCPKKSSYYDLCRI